jgi:GT2 family glycosyltransferase
MSEQPRVAVVIVSYETRDTLLEAVGGLAASLASGGVELVVVDNASTDGSAAAVRARLPGARVIENAENVGFARASNQGVRETDSPLLLFLNPDASLGPGALASLAGLFAERPRLGIAGPRMIDAQGEVEVTTGADLSLLAEWRQRRLVRGVARREAAALRIARETHSAERETDWVSGACLMARREAFLAVSGFDEGFFLYEEDADLCRRVRAAGWQVLFTPAAEARHLRGRSMARSPARARLEYQRSHLRYYAKHCGPASRLALRAWLAGRAALGAFAALVRGDEDERRMQTALWKLAVSAPE